MTPTIHDIPGPYRFFFFSFDCEEPKHVHVERDRAICKFWLDPLALGRNHGFAPHELSRIRDVIPNHVGRISDAWDEHRGQG